MTNKTHEQTQQLLPWYATGQLDAADRAQVEAHLASCARCQRELGTERILIDEFQTLTPEVDSGWAQLRGRIQAQQPQRPAIRQTIAEFWQLLTRPAVAALAAAQLAFVVIAGALLQWMTQPTYVALGSAPTIASANIIVMFQPETREASLRHALEASGASLAGGPTDAGAYLLHVPTNARPQALERLRHDSNVTLAEPIDGPRQ